MRPLHIIPFVLALVALSCAGVQNPAAPAPTASFRLIAIGDVAIGDLAPKQGDVRGLLVFDSQQAYSTWASGQNLRPPSGDPRDAMPSIDFAKEVAVVAYLGLRADASYHVRVDQVVANGSTLVVKAVEYRTCGGAATVITYPVTAIAVPRGWPQITASWSGPAGCQSN